MEFISIIKNIVSLFPKFMNWLLKKFGKRIVNDEDYQDDTIEVGFNYCQLSAKAIEEEARGAIFRWSRQLPNTNYERYFETEGNTRTFFRHREQILWINRP